MNNPLNEIDTTTPEGRTAFMLEKRKQKQAEALAYFAQRFDLKPEEVLGCNSGSCYDKIWVTTQEAAAKVAAAVKEETVNGGWFDGMSLGAITPDGKGGFEVMC